MKGITMCADCAYYNMKTHKCTRGCKIDPDVSKGENPSFYVDCPLPDVEPLQKWIPCSERMPTMNEMRQSDCVLVCALDENWIGMAYYIGDGWAFADAQTKPRLETVEITYWMPLPEPPEKE